MPTVITPCGGGGSGTLNLPIDLRAPRTTSLAGNAFFTNVSLSNYDFAYWQFLKTVDGTISGLVVVPPILGGTPAATITLNTMYAAVSGVAAWQIAYRFVSNNGVVDGALTSSSVVLVTTPGNLSRADAVFTLASQPSAGDLIVVTVSHMGTNGSDTMATNSLLLSAFLQIVT